MCFNDWGEPDVQSSLHQASQQLTDLHFEIISCSQSNVRQRDKNLSMLLSEWVTSDINNYFRDTSAPSIPPSLLPSVPAVRDATRTTMTCPTQKRSESDRPLSLQTN
ncbi:uncharacterized [Lates japonicus]